MRSGGGSAVQKALGAEAAGAVREAASLAMRRGHARVTPLHVLTALLSAPAGLLRAASQCPLQHHALEPRLSAALGRLPVQAWHTPAAPMSFQHNAPPLSNALVAALKRASARHRRGPRQSAAALPGAVEIEELVVSILDDPSVDRAMREAGLSSSQMKANVNAAAASLEQPAAGPNPFRVYKKGAMAGEQPSHGGTDLELLHRRPVVIIDPQRNLALNLSGDQAAIQANQIQGRPEHQVVGGSEVVTAASVPPWLRHCQDPTFLTLRFGATQAAAATCAHRPKFAELTAENLKVMCNTRGIVVDIM